MDIGLRLLVVLALVATNGFFVAGEFALVTVRKTRIEALAAQGHWGARAVRRALDDPNRFISACQLGITMASLALGWVGEATVATLLEEPLAVLLAGQAVGITAHAIAIPLAFAMITFLHITLGEQVPKMIALQRGEAIAFFSVHPTNFVGLVFRPFIAALYWFTYLVLRLLGLRWAAEEHQAYSPEEIKALIRSSQRGRVAGEDAGSLAERALDFAKLVARQVMVPRTEMVGVSADVDLTQLRELMRRHEHSRYPVFDGSPDNIIGVLSAKRLVAVLPTGEPTATKFNVRAHLSLPVFVHETMPAYLVLAALKQHRSHLAIVVDEYGATAGIVTLRDVMDRIAGEVRDEAEAEPPTVERLPDGSAIVDGLALLGDVETELLIKLVDSEYDTLGGFVFGRLGRRPALGDTVEVAGHRFTVEELDGLRVSRVRVQKADSVLDSGDGR